RGWTIIWSWFYKHVVPTGLALAVTVLFLLWPFAATAADDLIVTYETPAFTLDTRLPDGVAPSSGTVVTESGTFTLDTRLPDGVTPSSGTVVTESPPFTLDTRLPSDTTPLPNLVTQAESPAFTLDTRIPPLDVWWITRAESAPFTLDTLSGSFTTPAQTLTGGSTGGKARFSPDGLRLAKTDGNQVLLWNLHSIRTNSTFTGHAAEVGTLDFSPLGDQLLTGSADGTLRWWDTASRAELGRTSPSGAGTVYAAYASDGARILAGRGINAALYRVPSMQLLQKFTGSAGSISAVAVCPEGLALAGNSDRFAVIWDTATGQLLCRLTNHTKLITAAAFYPGGTNAFTASLDGTIRIWNTATGAEMLRIQAGAQVGGAALSLDGRVIASCDTATPGTASIWDAQTGSLLRVFTDTGSEASQIKGVAISPDQTALATTHVDGLVRLWNTGLDPRPIYPVTPLGIGTNSPVTLRSHGLYYFAMNADAGRSLVVTLEADPGSGSKLKRSADNSAGQGLSSDAEFANLGAGTFLSASGAASTAKSFRPAPTSADIAAFRMTAMKGKLPSEYDYETFAQASVTNLHCEMPVVTATSDKVYVLVFAPHLSAGNIQARIRAEYADFHLSNVSPVRGGNSGNVTARIQGTGITPDTAARLIGPGGAVASGQLALWADTTKAWYTFALSNAPAGSYQVEISKPGVTPMVLANAFQVVTAVGPQLQSSLTAPSAVRPGRDYGTTLKYANA
ncbi:MAG: WD40 repeat domain-containing protein, partial [Verrucomicrobia bacterium]|nr:WD40 repeat domain-containing protein [Verrucomicrobiota bacterium]